MCDLGSDGQYNSPTFIGFVNKSIKADDLWHYKLVDMKSNQSMHSRHL